MFSTKGKLYGKLDWGERIGTGIKHRLSRKNLVETKKKIYETNYIIKIFYEILKAILRKG